MKRLGMDIGTSTIKVAVLEDQVIKYKNIRKHYGKILPVLKEMLEEACAPRERMAMCVTGSNAQAVLGAEDEIPYLGYIPAVAEGVRLHEGRLLPHLNTGHRAGLPVHSFPI